MPATTMREYLVKLGYQIDQVSKKKFDISLESTEKLAAGVSATIGGITLALDRYVNTIAESQEKLYYSAQRTGSTVRGLQAVRYAAEQVGLTAEQITDSIEGLAQAQRLNPGIRALLQNWGIQPGQKDAAKTFIQLLDKLSTLPFPVAARMGQGVFGIPEDVLLMYEQNPKKFKDAYDKNLEMQRKAGVDANKNAEEFKEYQNQLRELNGQLDLLNQKLGVGFLPAATKATKAVGVLIDFFNAADSVTGNWATRLGAIVAALGSITAAKGALQWVGVQLGLRSSVSLGVSGGALAGAAATGAGIGLASKFYLDSLAKRWKAEADYNMEVEKYHNDLMLGNYGPRAKKAPADYKQQIVASAIQLGVDPKLALAVADQESGFDPNAVSKKGALGLFQLMPGTAKQLGVNPRDPAQNIKGGLTHLRDLLTKYHGNELLALAAYNAGEGNVAKYGGVPPFKETQGYVSAIEQARLGGNTPPNVTLQQHTSITVEGSDSPRETANVVAGEQRRVNGDLVRNFVGVVF